MKKNTRWFRKALSTSAVATPSASSPPIMIHALLALDFIGPLCGHRGYIAMPRTGSPPGRDQGHFTRHGRGNDGERAPDIQGVAPHGEEIGPIIPIPGPPNPARPPAPSRSRSTTMTTAPP